MTAYTALGMFGRTIRDEPDANLYKFTFWLEEDEVDPDEVAAWLRKRYVEAQTGKRFRIVTYKHQDGRRYVHQIKLEDCSDADLLYIKVRWGWSKTAVRRARRHSMKRLTREQRVVLKARIDQVINDFYDSL